MPWQVCQPGPSDACWPAGAMGIWGAWDMAWNVPMRRPQESLLRWQMSASRTLPAAGLTQ